MNAGAQNDHFRCISYVGLSSMLPLTHSLTFPFIVADVPSFIDSLVFVFDLSMNAITTGGIKQPCQQHCRFGR